MIAKFFPIVIIVLMFAAAVMCLIDGDVKKSAYWFFAAMLNLSVTV